MVRIITDSAADFEKEELLRKDIVYVPMKIMFKDEEYQENINLSKDRFYELLEECDEFPKTSQPSPFEFESVFRKMKEDGDECVLITISSALSGTYQNALLAKEMADFEACYVIDSLNATGGQRILVEEAVRLRDEGRSAKEIAEAVEALKSKVTLMACVDTLEYLYKGGRLSKAAYAVSSVVNIKPVIAVEEGKVKVCSKTLSMRQGIRALGDELKKHQPDRDYPFYVVYSHNRKNGDLLAESLRSLGIDVPEERIFNIGATIGSHVGKNACGYIYIAK